MLIWRCWSVRNSVLQAGEQSRSLALFYFWSYMQSLLQIRQQPVAGDDRGKQKMFRDCKASPIPRTTSSNQRWLPPIHFSNWSGCSGCYNQEQHGLPCAYSLACVVSLQGCSGSRGCSMPGGHQACAEMHWSGYDPVTDCSSVLLKLRSGGFNRSLVAPIIADALQESQQLQRVSFIKVGREQNKVAHKFQSLLAHLAIRLGSELLFCSRVC
jgi:hypothetical protein